MKPERIFLFEWLSCGGMAGENIYPSLAREGKAMFLALLEDLASIPGLEIITSLDLRSIQPEELPPQVEWVPAHPDPEGFQFREIAGKCSRSLVVAPEIGGALTRTSRWVNEAGCESLGSPPEVLEKVTDKWNFAAVLSKRGVPALPTIPWTGGQILPFSRCVVKLATGAGSFGTRLVNTPEEANQVHSWAEKNRLGKLVIQPYWEGQPTSVAALVGPSDKCLLVPTKQILSGDGTFGYLGGEAPLAPEICERISVLARKALMGFEGIRGWVGLDLILGNDGRSDLDVVVEINPRCTTSYTGLRQLTRINLLQAWMEVIAGNRVEINWKRGKVIWDNQGHIEVKE